MNTAYKNLTNIRIFQNFKDYQVKLININQFQHELLKVCRNDTVNAHVIYLGSSYNL